MAKFPLLINVFNFKRAAIIHGHSKHSSYEFSVLLFTILLFTISLGVDFYSHETSSLINHQSVKF